MKSLNNKPIAWHENNLNNAVKSYETLINEIKLLEQKSYKQYESILFYRNQIYTAKHSNKTSFDRERFLVKKHSKQSN